MTMIVPPFPPGYQLPTHLDLPESDGSIVQNFQEHPQSILLTDSILPVIQARHPDGRYAIGQDCGIYWRIAQPPEPLERGSVAPDWFYVPNVPPMPPGTFRRSYVLWQELVAPLVVIEFVSGDGSEERDQTPHQGKFWIYEQVIRPAFYGIYEVSRSRVEVYHHVEDHFELLPANERGHFSIPQMGVELGIWEGTYQDAWAPWLRWWDAQGQLLLTGHEIAAQERRLLEQERQLLEQERERSARLAERLRALGIDPEQV